MKQVDKFGFTIPEKENEQSYLSIYSDLNITDYGFHFVRNEQMILRFQKFNENNEDWYEINYSPFSKIIKIEYCEELEDTKFHILYNGFVKDNKEFKKIMNNIKFPYKID